MIKLKASLKTNQMTMSKEFNELRKVWRMMRLFCKENNFLAILFCSWPAGNRLWYLWFKYTKLLLNIKIKTKMHSGGKRKLRKIFMTNIKIGNQGNLAILTWWNKRSKTLVIKIFQKYWQIIILNFRILRRKISFWMKLFTYVW